MALNLGDLTLATRCRIAFDDTTGTLDTGELTLAMRERCVFVAEAAPPAGGGAAVIGSRVISVGRGQAVIGSSIIRAR